MSILRLDNTSEQNILNMLMENKIINAEQMKQIQSVSKEVGKTKLETALDRELTSENEIRKTLSESYSLPIVELKKYKLDDKLKKIIPFNYLEENSLVPFEFANNTLKIAIPDASKLSLMKTIKTITQMDPELYAASISDINNFINRIKISDPKITENGDPKGTQNHKKSSRILLGSLWGDLRTALLKKVVPGPSPGLPHMLPEYKYNGFRTFYKMPLDHLFGHFGRFFSGSGY